MSPGHLRPRTRALSARVGLCRSFVITGQLDPFCAKLPPRLIGEGSRSAKSVPLSREVKGVLGIEADGGVTHHP